MHNAEQYYISIAYTVCFNPFPLCICDTKKNKIKKPCITVELENFARRNFSPISPSALVGEYFYLQNFSPELMINISTFTALAKINSAKCFCNTKVTGLGEIFPTKFSAIQYQRAEDLHVNLSILIQNLLLSSTCIICRLKSCHQMQS